MFWSFFAEIDVVAGAQEALERLADQHTIFIATAAMEFPSSFDAKFRWLQRHFPAIPPANYVFCGDKSIIHADYLIDDQPRYLRKFRGKGLLFDAPTTAKSRAIRAS
jgi:5'-nucleotidase